MKKDETITGAGGGEKGVFAGSGSRANYPALLLFLLGGLLGGLSIYDSLRHGSSYLAYLCFALLCALVSLALIMRRGSGQ